MLPNKRYHPFQQWPHAINSGKYWTLADTLSQKSMTSMMMDYVTEPTDHQVLLMPLSKNGIQVKFK
jgi:hypothetical protein